MPSDFDRKLVGDIIGYGPKRRPHRILRFVGPRGVRGSVVLQELGRDSLGRLRSIGEDGRFSTTFGTVQSAPLYKSKVQKRG